MIANKTTEMSSKTVQTRSTQVNDIEANDTEAKEEAVAQPIGRMARFRKLLIRFGRWIASLVMRVAVSELARAAFDIILSLF